jgi:hypothetical protein
MQQRDQVESFFYLFGKEFPFNKQQHYEQGKRTSSSKAAQQLRLP